MATPKEVDSTEDLVQLWEVIQGLAKSGHGPGFTALQLETRGRETRLPAHRLRDALATLLGRGLIVVVPAIGEGPEKFYVVPEARDLGDEAVRRGWPPDGITFEAFGEKTRAWDPTLRAYFRLAVQTFERGVGEAALFFVGGAGERLVDAAIKRVETVAGTRKAPDKAGPRVDFLIDVLEKAIKAQQRPIAIDELAWLRNELHGLRFQRNDIGHPRETPPDVPRTAVGCRLQMFPELVKRLHATVALVT